MYDSYQLFSFFQIPLGVILKNENKNDDMVEIMTEMHKYVPTKLYEEEYLMRMKMKLYVSQEHLIILY